MQNETTRHKGKQEERQAGRQEGRQDLGKVDTPSNTNADMLRKHWEPLAVHCLGKKQTQTTRHKGKLEERQAGRQAGRQAETSWETREARPREGGRTIQQKETRRETRGDKISGRRTHHPTKGNKKGYKWRQRETRLSKRRTHHPTPRRTP